MTNAEKFKTAKMREALVCIDNIISHIEVGNVRDILHAYKNIHERIRFALSAPPRNCDVMSLETARKVWFNKRKKGKPLNRR